MQPCVVELSLSLTCLALRASASSSKSLSFCVCRRHMTEPQNKPDIRPEEDGGWGLAQARSIHGHLHTGTCLYMMSHLVCHVLEGHEQLGQLAHGFARGHAALPGHLARLLGLPGTTP